MKGKGANITLLSMAIALPCALLSLIQILSQDPDLDSSPTSTTYELCDLGRVI